MTPPAIDPALFPFESRFYDRQGKRYHFVDEGDGPPVLMVHGNPTWSFYFRNLITALRGSHRVLAVDHIGCGLSDKPSDHEYDFRLASRIDDLEAFIDSLHLQQPLTIVAHDWGGMIAMGWAVRHPEKVARIVLMNTAAFHLPDTMKLPWMLWFVRNTSLAAGMVSHLNLFSRGASILATKQPLSRAVKNAYCAPYDTAANRLATLRFVQDIPLEPSDPSYDTVTAIERGLPQFAQTPILLLWGDKDFVFRPEVANVFERFWPHAETHHFPEAGHYVLEDALDDIVALVHLFLAEKAE